MAPTIPKLTQVIIDSIDVSSYVLSWRIPEKLDQSVREASLVFKSTLGNALDYKDDSLNGKIITIKRGVSTSTEQFLFKGYVRIIDFKTGNVNVSCEDMLSEAKYKQVNQSFDYIANTEAGVISAIFTTLISGNLTGVTVDGTTVQNSGTVNIVQKVVYRRRPLIDCILELAYAIDWQFYYRPDTDRIYFEPKGFGSSSNVLTVGQNVVQNPKWSIDSSSLFNKIYVSGSPQEAIFEEGAHLLDGSTTNWSNTRLTMQNSFNDMQVFCDLTNPPTTQKTLGILNSTTPFDYSVDKDLKTVTFNTSTFAPTTSYYAKTRYTYYVPVSVTRYNATSISTYTLKEESQYREDIKTNADAENWADKQLSIYSTPFYSTILLVNGVDDLRPALSYQVVDNVNGVNRIVMIKEIEFNYPYRYDKVTVGDKEFRTANWGVDTVQRLKRLEETSASNSDFLVSIVDLNTSLQDGCRYFYREGHDTTSNVVYDRFDAIYDTSNYDDSTPATNVVFMMQGNNTYQEYVFDTDFYDSVNSTSTSWNTTTKVITITVGGVLISKYFALGWTPTAFTVTSASISGTNTIEISADGKVTWQTVTLNVRNTLISANTSGVYFRITATSGTTTIQNTYDAEGELSAPALQIILEN